MADLQDLNPQMRDAWLKGALPALQKAGINPTVTSGYRSYGQQAALWANRANNPNPVARPGHSAHESGAAMDIHFDPGDEAVAYPIMERYGFVRPYGDRDRPHWELASLQQGGGGAAPSTPGLTPIQQMAVETANRYGVPPSVLLATIERESSFRPGVTSTTRDGRVDVGLGQLSPGVAQRYGVKDRTDPGQNAAGTAQYLRDLHAQYGDWDSAIAHYIGYGSADAYRSSHDYGRQSALQQQWDSKLTAGGQAAAPQGPDGLNRLLFPTGKVVDDVTMSRLMGGAAPQGPDALNNLLFPAGKVVDDTTMGRLMGTPPPATNSGADAGSPTPPASSGGDALNNLLFPSGRVVDDATMARLLPPATP